MVHCGALNVLQIRLLSEIAMVQTIYNEMWDNFSVAMKQKQYELDSSIDNPDDTRRGITALAFLEQNNPSAAREITWFLKQVKQIEPGQYYHPQNELHLTILSIITCVSGFRLADIKPAQYIEVFNEAMTGTDPIEIRFQGITATPSCIMVQGFPVGDGLEQVRNRFRDYFKESGLYSSIDSRYKLATAHVSVIRFRSPIADTERLVSLCKKYKNHHFGSIRFTEFELVFNNWYQNHSVGKQLEKFSLK